MFSGSSCIILSCRLCAWMICASLIWFSFMIFMIVVALKSIILCCRPCAWMLCASLIWWSCLTFSVSSCTKEKTFPMLSARCFFYLIYLDLDHPVLPALCLVLCIFLIWLRFNTLFLAVIAVREKKSLYHTRLVLWLYVLPWFNWAL